MNDVRKKVILLMVQAIAGEKSEIDRKFLRGAITNIVPSTELKSYVELEDFLMETKGDQL